MAPPPTNHSESTGPRPLLDRILDCLNDGQSRYLLYYLREEGSAEIEDAAQHIAAKMHDMDATDVPDDMVENVLVSLHHRHLPKLAEHGIINYDQHSGSIKCDDPCEEMELFLDVARSLEEENYRFKRGAVR